MSPTSNAEDAPKYLCKRLRTRLRIELEGLKFTLGATGLTSLKYNGEELLFKQFGGVDLCKRPKFTKADGTIDITDEKAKVQGNGNSVMQTFSWGRIQARYAGDPSCLTIRLAIENTSNGDLQSLELRLAVLKFPERPTCAVVDVWMWGNGGVSKLGGHPIKAGGKNYPPVIAIQSPMALMHFVGDTRDEDAGLGIPFSADGVTSRVFPFLAYIGAIPAGSKRELAYSLRFSPDGPITFEAARDVLEASQKTILSRSSGTTGDRSE